MHDRAARRVARRSTRALLAAVTVTAAACGLAACQSDFLPAEGDWQSSVGPSPSVAPSPSRGPGPSASASPAEPAPEPTPAPAPVPEPAPAPVAPGFDAALHSIDDPASPWVVSNKLRPLTPAGFVPPDLVVAQVPFISNPYLRTDAAAAIAVMFATAAAEGAGAMQIQNAYRAYDTQVRVYGDWVSRVGQASADAQSARPGHSEHQTGFGVDITALPESCSIQECFGQTPQGSWLAGNAHRFGFILRYPVDKTAVTGFIYEPWHFRYVGPELSTEMRARGVTTLEEFFGLPAAPAYAG